MASTDDVTIRASACPAVGVHGFAVTLSSAAARRWRRYRAAGGRRRDRHTHRRRLRRGLPAMSRRSTPRPTPRL